jgi:hypothetical protein
MVSTTQVRFLVGVNYGVDLKKNPLAGETGVREFSKPENRGGGLTPTGLA